MQDIKVSIFASAVRVPFYKIFLESLRSTSIPFEVVFAGHNTPEEIKPFTEEYPFFKYIHTAPIKPEQCYDAARRACVGDAIHITADDAEYSSDCIGKAYNYWKSLNDIRTMLSIQTIENMQFCDMKAHRFFWHQPDSPIMAPMFFMSRQLLEDMGGFDRRYICGQGENDIVMRFVMEENGKVEIWGDKENNITLDHMRRHGLVRPFATGYNHDRAILEGSWGNGKKVLSRRRDIHEPYTHDETFLLKSQSFNKQHWV
ncbi:MAG: hypothetical protein AAB706_03465 [Patescibacteria group bacterium]